MENETVNEVTAHRITFVGELGEALRVYQRAYQTNLAGAIRNLVIPQLQEQGYLRKGFRLAEPASEQAETAVAA